MSACVCVSLASCLHFIICNVCVMSDVCVSSHLRLYVGNVGKCCILSAYFLCLFLFSSSSVAVASSFLYFKIASVASEMVFKPLTSPFAVIYRGL